MASQTDLRGRNQWWDLKSIGRNWAPLDAWANLLDFGAVGDSVTDDTAAVNAWMNCGAQFYFAPQSPAGGEYKITTPITLPPAVFIITGGGGFFWGGSDLVNTALFKIDTTGGVLFDNVYFDGGNTTTNMYGIWINGANDNTLIHNCTFFGFRFPIYVDGGGIVSNFGVTDSQFSLWGQTAIWAADGTASNYRQNYYKRNIILGTGSQTHHCANVTGDYIEFSDNFVYKGVTTKFGVAVNGGSGTKVSRNILLDCAGDQMDVLSRGGLQLRHFNVSDNIGLQINVANSDGAGISVVCDSDSAGNAVFDGVVSNNYSEGASGGGIGVLNLSSQLNATVSDVLLVGNVVINPNQANTSSPAGSAPGFFAASALGNAIQRCMFLDNYAYSSDSKMRYGFSETGSGVNNNLVDSEFRGYATGPFLLAGNNSFVRKYPYIVSGLPSVHTNLQGERALVTDATVTTFASIVAGTGGNIVPVYSDGTAWRIG